MGYGDIAPHTSSESQLSSFLSSIGLSHLAVSLQDASIDRLASAHAASRTQFLSWLQNSCGVTRLQDRQALANALARRARALMLQPIAAALLVGAR